MYLWHPSAHTCRITDKHVHVLGTYYFYYHNRQCGHDQRLWILTPRIVQPSRNADQVPETTIHCALATFVQSRGIAVRIMLWYYENWLGGCLVRDGMR
jgi:hypothetical protein